MGPMDVLHEVIRYEAVALVVKTWRTMGKRSVVFIDVLHDKIGDEAVVLTVKNWRPDQWREEKHGTPLTFSTKKTASRHSH